MLQTDTAPMLAYLTENFTLDGASIRMLDSLLQYVKDNQIPHTRSMLETVLDSIGFDKSDWDKMTLQTLRAVAPNTALVIGHRESEGDPFAFDIAEIISADETAIRVEILANDCEIDLPCDDFGRTWTFDPCV